MSNNQPDTIETYFSKRGIKTRVNVAEDLTFVGKNTRTTFTEMTARMASRFTVGDTEVAALGEAYESGYYKRTPGSLEKTYESVYGDTDYARAVNQNLANKELLDQAYGNNDNDREATLSQEATKQTMAQQGITKSNRPTTVEIHRWLYASQTEQMVRDEDTRGIRSIEDKSAPIEPIA